MFEKIACILAFYIPFQIALNPVDYLDLASIRLVLSILFLFWITHSLFIKKFFIPLNKTAIFIYIFLFLSLFSIFIAQNQYWSIRKMVFLLSIFPIYLIFSTTFNKNLHYKVLKWLIYGSLVISLIGIIQFLLQFIIGLENIFSFWAKWITPLFLGKSFSASVIEHNSWLVNIGGNTIFRLVSLFPDPHMLSFYTGMTAPLSLSLFLKNKNKLFLVFFFIILLADLLSFSRGGYLGLMFGFFVFISFLMLKNNNWIKKRRLPIIFLTSMLVLMIFFSPFKTRLMDSFNLHENSNSERIRLWKDALKISLENPFGVGLGNFPLKVLPSAEYRDPIYAHNLYLDILSEIGFLGLISFLGIIFSSIFYFKRKSINNLFYIGPLVSLVIFLIHSFFENPLFSVHNLALLFIILSLSSEKYD